MTVRIAQFVHATHDVVDDAFLKEFPEIEAVKADNPEGLAAALAGAEIFHAYNSAFTPEFARLVRENGRALKWIQFTTVGIDIALKAGLPDGVWVTNSGDVNQRVLAGHAMALMLGVMRGFRRFEPLRAQHDYARKILPQYMVAPDGCRMVILGMGRIGQDIARKAKAFDMEVICVTRAATPAVPEIDQVVAREKVNEVLPTADVVMIALPLDGGTRGFLSAERIALLKDTAVVVNISRGKVVDEQALARALAEGRIMGAGLDAFASEPLPPSSPLWNLPNVVMTPHVGGSGGRELWRRMRDLVRDNTRRYLSGAPLKHVVRKPDGTLVEFDSQSS
jgi:phosphoglycerate dehydrogenase-like enzyme